MENLKLLEIHPFKDTRGQLKKILMKSMLENEQEIQEVYVLYTNKDTVRGNHYHEKTVEYFTVLSGEALIVLADKDLTEFEYISVKADDNTTVKVEPFTVHAIKNVSEEPLILLAISSKEYRPEETDTIQMNIL